MKDAIIAAGHAKTATVNLAKALHWHRFFGQPVDGFSARHNLARAEVNVRRVAALAAEAGRYACYAHDTAPSLDDLQLGAVAKIALEVDAISTAYLDGFARAADELAGAADLGAGGGAPALVT